MKDNLKLVLDSLETHSCMPLKGIEIIKYLYPQSLHCSNSRCPKNKMMYFEKSEDPLKEKSIIGLKEECAICKKINFEFPENVKHHINGINNLSEILEKRKVMNQNQKPLNFLTIDLRKDKKDGILSKSHMVDFANFNDKMSYDMINDFIEYKDSYHFAFFVSNHENNLNDSEKPNKENTNEKFLTQPDENFGFLITFNFSYIMIIITFLYYLCIYINKFVLWNSYHIFCIILANGDYNYLFYILCDI